MMRSVRIPLWLVLLLGVRTAANADSVTTFEGLLPTPNTFNNGSDGGGNLLINGNSYNNSYDPSFGGIWYGWSISNTTDTTTSGPSNQYSSVTGGGANGSATYAVGFTFGDPAFNQVGNGPSDPGDPITNRLHPSDTTIQLAPGTTPVSNEITNTTYSYLTMQNGFAQASAFVPGDFQALDIRGFDASGAQVGPDIVVDMGDFLGKSLFLLNTWETVDLSSLAGATTLRFGIRSSQNDPGFGVNTPAYFAADDFDVSIAAVPEPGVLFMMGPLLLVGWAVYRKRRAAAVVTACLLAGFSAPTARADSDPQVGQPRSLPVFPKAESSRVRGMEPRPLSRSIQVRRSTGHPAVRPPPKEFPRMPLATSLAAPSRSVTAVRSPSVSTNRSPTARGPTSRCSRTALPPAAPVGVP